MPEGNPNGSEVRAEDTKEWLWNTFVGLIYNKNAMINPDGTPMSRTEVDSIVDAIKAKAERGENYSSDLDKLPNLIPMGEEYSVRSAFETFLSLSKAAGQQPMKSFRPQEKGGIRV